MTQVIKFHAQDEYVDKVKLRPVPASKMLPDWFKNMPPYSDNKLKFTPHPNITARRCAPLLDGLVSGYIMPLWSDIEVSQVGGKPYIKWISEYPVVDVWSAEQSATYEPPEGFDNSVFKYFHGWIPETPRGYSCLITHPIGYPNLPIKSITGVIDSDILKTEANSPFVVKKGFEGLIKRGTPMFQIIPFKRDEWKAEFDVMKDKEYMFMLERLRTKMISSYSSIRHKKVYR